MFLPDDFVRVTALTMMFSQLARFVDVACSLLTASRLCGKKRNAV